MSQEAWDKLVDAAFALDDEHPFFGSMLEQGDTPDGLAIEGPNKHMATALGDWDETKHQRDEHGRFATFAAFEKQSLKNLASTSRTAQGINDTSSSADKPELKVQGDKLAEKTEANVKDTLQYVWDNRDMAVNSPKDIEKLVTTINAKVNDGLLQKGQSPFRTWATNYPTVPPEGIQSAMQGFYREMYSRVSDPTSDPVANAAWAEQRINGTIHPFADGVGRSSKAISGWVLSRANHSLPSLPDRDTYNKAVGSDPTTFERAYRSWFSQKHSEVALAGDFDETKHPRGHGGKFTTGDSTKTTGIKEASAHAKVPARPASSPHPGPQTTETWYHGTSKQALDSIMKEGLEPGHAGGADDWAKANGYSAMQEWKAEFNDRESSVYITHDNKVAARFARTVSDQTKTDPVVLELHVPRNSNALKMDEADPSGNSYRWDGKIKPEWIAKTWPVNKSGQRVRIGFDENGPRVFYMVIPTIPPWVKMADWDETQHPRDNHGRFGSGIGAPTKEKLDEHDAALAQFAQLHGVDSKRLAETTARITAEATTDAERKYAQELAVADIHARDTLAQGDTKSQNTRPDGLYTPEREAVHDEIIRNYLKDYQAVHGQLPPTGLEHPVVTFMSGMPGAGKSSAAKDILTEGSGKVISIDPDTMKAYFPEYNNGFGSAAIARESGDVADKLMEYAARQRMNIVIDGTMKTSGALPSTFGDGAIGKMAAFQDKGYRVETRFVDASVPQSITSTVTRFHNEFQQTGTGRYVALGFTRALADDKYGTAPRRSFELAKNTTYNGKPLIDAWTDTKSYMSGGGLTASYGTLSKGGVGQ